VAGPQLCETPSCTGALSSLEVEIDQRELVRDVVPVEACPSSAARCVDPGREELAREPRLVHALHVPSVAQRPLLTTWSRLVRPRGCTLAQTGYSTKQNLMTLEIEDGFGLRDSGRNDCGPGGNYSGRMGQHIIAKYLSSLVARKMARNRLSSADCIACLCRSLTGRMDAACRHYPQSRNTLRPEGGRRGTGHTIPYISYHTIKASPGRVTISASG
jgi:hypothetical protein